VNPVQSLTPELSDKLSKYPEQSVIVGVNDNLAYATPACALVGATHDIRVIYDTGLRPDPRIVEGQVSHGERVATQIEIVQSAGRPGRLGKQGAVYYTVANAMPPGEGEALYDLMLSAIVSALELPEAEMSFAAGQKLWKSSGTARVVRVAEGKSESFGDAADQHSATVSKDEYAEEELVGAPPSYSSGETSDSKPLKLRTKISASEKKRIFHPDELTIRTTVRRGSASLYGDVVGDDDWSPFEADEAGKTRLRGYLFRVFDKLSSALRRGDKIKVEAFPRLRDGAATVDALNDARRVMANRMVPTFMDDEVLAVLVWYNRSVPIINLNNAYLAQYVSYFELYGAHLAARYASTLVEVEGRGGEVSRIQGWT